MSTGPKTHPDTFFVSSGGGTELDQRSDIAIAILGKVFRDVEIWVLKDRDMASGRSTDEKDRRIYLENNPGNHRVLRRREIENYLYDKDVLKAYCSANTLSFDEVAYDAFVTDINNQNIKGSTGRIKNFCDIKSNISADQFKIALSKHLLPDMPVSQQLEECIFGSD